MYHGLDKQIVIWCSKKTQNQSSLLILEKYDFSTTFICIYIFLILDKNKKLLSVLHFWLDNPDQRQTEQSSFF